MAFWGVELKRKWPAVIGPNNPRLHVSAATLGSDDEILSDTERKTKVECSFGKKKSVLLCCLDPDKSETCQIHVEFEESSEVVFRVISGSRTVHLIGYHTSHSDGASEPAGIDLGEADTENSENSQGSSEYGGSFIVPDDDPLSAGESNEDMPKVSRPRLTKKYDARDSDETPRQKDFAAKELLWDSDPEDQMLISSHSRTKCASNAYFPAKEKGDIQPKRKRGEDEPIDQNGTQNQVGDQNETQNQVDEPIDQNGTQNQVDEPIDQNETQNRVDEPIDQNETLNQVNDRKSKKKKMCKDEEGGAMKPYVAEMETTTTTKP